MRIVWIGGTKHVPGVGVLRKRKAPYLVTDAVGKALISQGLAKRPTTKPKE